MDPGTANEGRDRRQWREFDRRVNGHGAADGHPDLVTVAAYLDRRLPDTERTAVEEHLADCGDCAALVHEVHELLAAASTPVLVPAAVTQAAGALVPGGSRRRPGLAWRNAAWWSAAAIVTLAVGLGGYRAGRATLSEAEMADRLGEAMSFTLDQADAMDFELALLEASGGTP